MFLLGSADDGHGGEAFLITAVFPRVLAIPEFPEASFPYDFFHGGMKLLRKPRISNGFAPSKIAVTQGDRSLPVAWVSGRSRAEIKSAVPHPFPAAF